MQPNLVYHNILITKKRETQIKFFSNKLALSIFIWMWKLDAKERLYAAEMKSLRAMAGSRLLQGTVEL